MKRAELSARIVTGTICVIAACFLMLALSQAWSRYRAKTKSVFSNGTYSEEEIRTVLSQIKPSPVVCEVLEPCYAYAELNSDSAVQAVLRKGAKVEILQDRTALWYKVLDYETEKIGWIERKFIKIPPEPPVNRTRLSPETVEAFVNLMGFESGSGYFVWTDIDRQRTYVLQGEKGSFKLVKQFVCATGKNESPTTRGLYTLTERGEWFYSERLKSGGKYWVKFNGPYLFHSVSMDRNKNVLDDTLGARRSSGCVRLSMEDIMWFYQNVGYGTGVFLY